ncbi:MAG: hypothetical protein IJQ67_05845 [Bacilli bacterium]|nr:hypothetical protein [Bacilli bacterium]
MEKVNELKIKIENLAEVIASKKDLIKSRESRIESRAAALGDVFTNEKKDVKKHLNDVLKDVRVSWTKVKEAYRTSKLKVDVNQVAKDLVYDEADPLLTINKMLDRYNSDLASLNSAYDLTQSMATNANTLIELLQKFISDFSKVFKNYWSGTSTDEESKAILKEITDIENDIEELIEDAIKYYDELKIEVNKINEENKKKAGDVHKKTEEFSLSVILNLGLRRDEKETIEFNDDIFGFEPLKIYDYVLYELILGSNDHNDSSMIVVEDESIKEKVKNIIISRIKEAYPENLIQIINRFEDYEEREEFLIYNHSHEDNPVKIQFIMSNNITPSNKTYLQNKAFIFLIVNKEESKKYRGKIINNFRAFLDNEQIILTDDDIEITLDK